MGSKHISTKVPLANFIIQSTLDLRHSPGAKRQAIPAKSLFRVQTDTCLRTGKPPRGQRMIDPSCCEDLAHRRIISTVADRWAPARKRPHRSPSASSPHRGKCMQSTVLLRARIRKDGVANVRAVQLTRTRGQPSSTGTGREGEDADADAAAVVPAPAVAVLFRAQSLLSVAGTGSGIPAPRGGIQMRDDF